MTFTPESPSLNQDMPAETPPPVAHYGGFRYNKRRNAAVLAYIRSKGHDTVEPLPDPRRMAADEYTVVANGMHKVISTREAMKYVGDKTVVHSVSRFQQERAKELNEHHETLGHDQVNAIFQSADALMGLQAVHQRPESYRNIILAYPAGIARQPRPLKASGGVMMGALKSGRAARALSSVYDYEAHLRAGGKPHTPADRAITQSVALSYQAPLLNEIRKDKNAPGISLVLGLNDTMMPPAEVIKELRSPDDVDFILITDTPHGINGRKDVMDKTLELLQATEQARLDRKAGKPTLPLGATVALLR